ncbi:MAG: hypothetical protein DRI57_33145 [Deltaproteobacteria bacterium]|nr:MAG: hypothetical protein DRI57_33145 [Deltaproteobacteria bacterium]
MEPITKLRKKSESQIKLFVVIFDFKLEKQKIPAFRAAVVEKVGRENVLFHNHLGEKFLYAYPLIQYKTIRQNPAIVCVDKGTEDILEFFKKTDWHLNIHGRTVETEIRHIDFDHFVCGFSPDPLHYRIRNWFALNEGNFRKFIALDDAEAKSDFLQRIMIGNILSFAKGIHWNVRKRIELVIPEIPKRRLLSFKRYQMMGFDLDFITNISLPNLIGLGKSVSRGFGTITRT